MVYLVYKTMMWGFHFSIKSVSELLYKEMLISFRIFLSNQKLYSVNNLHMVLRDQYKFQKWTKGYEMLDI